MSLKDTLETQVSVAGKHVLSSQGVIKMPDDTDATLTLGDAYKMYAEALIQMKQLGKIVIDWELEFTKRD